MKTHGPELVLPANLQAAHKSYKIDLLGDRYLVQKVDPKMLMPPERYQLILPDQAEKSLGWAGGVVLEVGNGHRLERNEQVPMHYAEGDNIMFVAEAGHEINLLGKRYWIVNQTEVFGRIVEAHNRAAAS